MTVSPATPQPDLTDLDNPLGGVYAAGVAKAFVAAVAEKLPAVIEHLCDREHRLSLPGGRMLAAYMASERMWAEALRHRVFALAQQCSPLVDATTVIYETEWYVRRELGIIVFAASASVIDGDRGGALHVGLEEASRRGESVRAALLTVMNGRSVIADSQGDDAGK